MRPSEADSPGDYVYMIRCHKRFKIGRTRNPKHRLATLKTSMPYEVEVIAVGRFSDASGKESFIHTKLKREGRHRKGEWFELDRRNVRELTAIINRGSDNRLEEADPFVVPTGPRGYGAVRSGGGKVHATYPHGSTLCGKIGSVFTRIPRGTVTTITCKNCRKWLIMEGLDKP